MLYQEWIDRRMARSDLSQYLTHFTRAYTDSNTNIKLEACEVLFAEIHLQFVFKMHRFRALVKMFGMNNVLNGRKNKENLDMKPTDLIDEKW